MRVSHCEVSKMPSSLACVFHGNSNSTGLQAKLICVEKLLPHLQPSDDDLQKSVLKAQADFENTARTLNSTSLGGGKPEVGCCLPMSA